MGVEVNYMVTVLPSGTSKSHLKGVLFLGTKIISLDWQ